MKLPVQFTWKCMTARIIAVSNSPGLRRVSALLMHDNCQGDEQAVAKPREGDKKLVSSVNGGL